MDSAPAGATRMGSRSSTRHGGPAQVFVGPVRKWRKVWSPVTSSAPSPSACRVVLYKWTPLTPSNGGVKEDSAVPEETTPPPARPVKYIPIAAVILKNREEIARKAAEEAEAQAQAENDMQEAKETTTTITTTTDMEVDKMQPDAAENEEKAGACLVVHLFSLYLWHLSPGLAMNTKPFMLSCYASFWPPVCILYKL